MPRAQPLAPEPTPADFSAADQGAYRTPAVRVPPGPSRAVPAVVCRHRPQCPDPAKCRAAALARRDARPMLAISCALASHATAYLGALSNARQLTARFDGRRGLFLAVLALVSFAAWIVLRQAPIGVNVAASGRSQVPALPRLGLFVASLIGCGFALGVIGNAVVLGSVGLVFGAIGAVLAFA